MPVRRWADPGPLSDDGWMHLHEVVTWVAYREETPPKYGSEDFGDGLWIDSGDREEDDQKRVNAASNAVRTALSQGNLVAWGQAGIQPQIAIESAHWARAFGNVVSDWSIRFDGFDTVLVSKKRVRQIWPASPRTRGRPPKHDWNYWRKIADEVIRDQPGISRTKLSETLALEGNERGFEGAAPGVDQFRKHLEEWGLPPAK
jgi:hypothetical protein